jgi:hypothetical protein
VIDLTGYSGIAAYVMSARTFASPFLYSGFHWSNGWARAVVRNIPCEKAAGAWIVWTGSKLEPGIATSVLGEAGLDFPDGYRLAFSVSGARGEYATDPAGIAFFEPKDYRRNLESCVETGKAANLPQGTWQEKLPSADS